MLCQMIVWSLYMLLLGFPPLPLADTTLDAIPLGIYWISWKSLWKANLKSKQQLSIMDWITDYLFSPSKYLSCVNCKKFKNYLIFFIIYAIQY